MDQVKSAGATQKEIRDIERSAILSKAVERVKDQADHQRAVRVSPQRYGNVQSKVARCIKV